MKPIIFSGEMVRAILDGRKTMTRRVVKPQPPEGFRAWHGCVDGNAAWTDHPMQGEKGQIINAKCPYGAQGDKLWVRETFMVEHFPSAPDNPRVHYRADNTAAGSGWTAAKMWKPSIFMPRWASRITLEIVNVRVERLQEISEEDAIAEGIDLASCHHAYALTIGAYAELWDTINEKRGYSWDSNPYVWIVEFKRI